MRKLFFLVALLHLIFPAFAQDETVAITWPPPVYDISGTITVYGSANPPDFAAYYLEVAEYEVENPLWIPISLPARTAVVNGALANWDTSATPDGLYQLRLQVQLSSVERLYSVNGPIRVGNQLARPAGEAVVAQPTIALPAAEPTAVPTPTLAPRPNAVSELPIPVGGQVQNFDDSTKAYMDDAGMTWVKWQIPYIIDDYNLFNVARDRINWSHEAGFNVLLSITGEVEKLDELGADYYPRFAEFLGGIAALQPDAIEVWNEMNLDREWPQGKIDPSAYAEMLRQAYTAIKAVDPQVMVITGALAPTGAEGAFGLARVWNDDRYYLGMANAGVADYADCIGVHYNEGIIPPQQQGGDPRQPDYPPRYLPLMIQRAAFPFRGQDIPLCFTELGYLSPEGYPPLPSGFAWAVNTSVQEQATWLRDAVDVAANFDGVDTELIIVFNMDFERYDDDPQAGYAIIRADGSCPACDELGTLRGSRG